jgi:signal transduction histidine kinase
MAEQTTAPNFFTSDGLRTAESDVIDHIQDATEHQKALLARELHDELGGLLVGAVMDVAWAEQHVSAPPAELKQKLLRARQTLSAAIDLKRRLIEELRPTLLDNVGLFAALRWHVQATCKRAEIDCAITLPEEERRFRPNIPITLFRIVQEALAVMSTAAPAASAEFTLTVSPPTLTILITRDRAASDLNAPASTAESHSLAAIEYRTSALNGQFSYTEHEGTGSAQMQATFPLDALLASA